MKGSDMKGGCMRACWMAWRVKTYSGKAAVVKRTGCCMLTENATDHVH